MFHVKKDTDECLQEKCSHNKMNIDIDKKNRKLMLSLCPMCECGAVSNIINKNCKKCICCENDPDYVRGKGSMDKIASMIMEQIAEENGEKKIMKELPELPEFNLIKKKAQITNPTALFILFIGLLLVAYIMALPPELRRVLLG
jgi:hypothetical protein